MIKNLLGLTFDDEEATHIRSQMQLAKEIYISTTDPVNKLEALDKYLTRRVLDGHYFELYDKYVAELFKSRQLND